jgi:hypothetical protein
MFHTSESMCGAPGTWRQVLGNWKKANDPIAEFGDLLPAWRKGLRAVPVAWSLEECLSRWDIDDGIVIRFAAISTIEAAQHCSEKIDVCFGNEYALAI